MGDVLPNPWTESAAFDRFSIAGVAFTGVVDLDASALLKKKADHRRGRGRNGGRSVATGWDLVEFSVTLSAFSVGPAGEAHPSFEQLQEIVRRVGRGSVATQDTNALSVAHPYLAAVGITQATLSSLGFVPVQGGGRLGLKLSLKEFRPPTQAPGARTPDPAPQQAEDGEVPRAGHRGLEAYATGGRTLPLPPRAPARPSSDP